MNFICKHIFNFYIPLKGKKKKVDILSKKIFKLYIILS